ncbi:DUF2017 domain-containing protein [Hoyosella sp. YIM 151337]|uniref:oxidative stress transcriptional regulator AosR n=1 Tax=Hoyosella sp. YIM 151337 TaxID=2992742 RepID=UPI00223616B5|nr:DUF2017 domain-containing protein [Hoyosella sp. YIM 151337]MCW4352137.1 DUF2017 domain-containing protein [Hoyosella sp. YIM 151337]
MHAWSRKNTIGGLRLRSQIDAHEAKVLRSVVQSVVAMLDERESGSPHDELEELTGLRTGATTPPENSVLARLLPEFHRQDEEAPGKTERPDDVASLNSALRSLNEPLIIEEKRGVASVLLDTVPPEGGKISLTPEQADAWISAVNDARLALGTMLEISHETPEEIDPNDPRAPQLGVYHWLTWIQDSLVTALVGER